MVKPQWSQTSKSAKYFPPRDLIAPVRLLKPGALQRRHRINVKAVRSWYFHVMMRLISFTYPPPVSSWAGMLIGRGLGAAYKDYASKHRSAGGDIFLLGTIGSLIFSV
jgi:hypothetical protein